MKNGDLLSTTTFRVYKMWKNYYYYYFEDNDLCFKTTTLRHDKITMEAHFHQYEEEKIVRLKL